MFISVIVPVYNVEEYLDKCLESLLNQHYSDMEIVVVDDKSTDGSLNIAKKYQKYTNVKVIAKEKNSGLSDTRNVGIKESCGQYIMFLDSDDYVENGCIAKIQGIIEKENTPDIIYFGYCEEYESTDKQLIKYGYVSAKNCSFTGEKFALEELKQRNLYAAACFGVYKRAFIVENQLYFESGILHEDELWTPQVILRANKIYTSDYVFYHYLRRMEKESGLPVEKILTVWRDYLSMAKKIGENLKDSIVYRPRELERRHDEAVIALQEIDTKQRAEELREKFPNLEKVCREITPIYQSLKDEKYAVLVPQKIEDIIKEGKALHHCVGTQECYFDRISRKTSYIVFLRRQEELEKEFYTMEIEPDGNIVQKSKDYNRTGEDYEEAEPFLKKWKKNVLKKIRNQEKDPTKTQVTLWTAELSAAYKDHVVMRGGKYQGQYLSDVLKAEQEAAA